MTDPCVRVPREDGEATRQALAEAELVDQRREIVHEDGQLYIPISDPDAVPEEYAVVDYETSQRETQTTPDELVEFTASYERLGEVIIIDEDDPERARTLADAIVESDLPVKTVLNRASKIRGEERIRDWEVLFGEETAAVHREYGCEFALDLATVYFSPRLATERHRVTEQVEDGEQVIDMFAGVGPFAIPMAKRGAEVVGVDINEQAIEYLRANAERNGVDERVTAIHGDVREIADEYEGWADRLVMNLPHSADAFVETAVSLAGQRCVFHYYDIQHEDDLFGPGERAIREAAESEYEVTVQNRHTVRSYAPREYNVVLDVELAGRDGGG
jgi:tRNA (guanine37-N1)-methyltransferase